MGPPLTRAVPRDWDKLCVVDAGGVVDAEECWRRRARAQDTKATVQIRGRTQKNMKQSIPTALRREESEPAATDTVPLLTRRKPSCLRASVTACKSRCIQHDEDSHHLMHLIVINLAEGHSAKSCTDVTYRECWLHACMPTDRSRQDQRMEVRSNRSVTERFRAGFNYRMRR